MREKTAAWTTAWIAGLVLLLASGCSGPPSGGTDTGPPKDVEADTRTDADATGDTSEDGQTPPSDTETDSASPDADDGASDTTDDTADDTSAGDTSTNDTSMTDTTGDTSETADGTADGGVDADSTGCGPDSGTCNSDQYCDFPDDNCGGVQSGTCEPQPQGCPTVVDPVCGCDDNTYNNSCKAHANGVDVQYEGNCQTSGCGPNGGSCASDEYCDFPDDNCGDGQPGTCKPRPQICPTVVDPVCGCDDMTYSNSCKAAADGVDVQSQKKCN